MWYQGMNSGLKLRNPMSYPPYHAPGSQKCPHSSLPTLVYSKLFTQNKLAVQNKHKNSTDLYSLSYGSCYIVSNRHCLSLLNILFQIYLFLLFSVTALKCIQKNVCLSPSIHQVPVNMIFRNKVFTDITEYLKIRASWITAGPKLNGW